jgi:hypothetical protein
MVLTGRILADGFDQTEGEAKMSQAQPAPVAGKFRRFSLDTWAVLLAFALAALVRAGLFKHIPW